MRMCPIVEPTKSIGAGRLRCRELEVGVLDDPEEIAERVQHGGDLDAAADVLNAAVLASAELQETGVRRLGVRHSPVGGRATGAGGALRSIRIQAQLVAADV